MPARVLSYLSVLSPWWRQVQELTSANTQKAAMIEDLLGEVQLKTEQLQEAQGRIEELEQRIELLEAEKAKSMEVGHGDCRVEGSPHGLSGRR